jgi:hypothetical protein
MIDNSIFIQSEIDYRRAAIRRSFAAQRRGRSRASLARRIAAASASFRDHSA